MDRLFHKVNGTLQDLEASQKMTVRDIDSMKRTLESLKSNAKKSVEALVELRGTFKSIETMLMDHESRIAALEKKHAS